MPYDEDLIKYEILQGLLQVDSSFVITSIYFEYDPETRKLVCSFTASNEIGQTVSEVMNYA